MFTENRDFEAWMQRIMERFDRLESLIDRQEEQIKPPTIDGERLYDNQDMCLLLNICKRTLQRYRTLGWLPFKRIDKKAYYTESDVKRFVEERAGRKSLLPNAS
jgi:DNA-binding transcriptional MerR regulator